MWDDMRKTFTIVRFLGWNDPLLQCPPVIKFQL